MVESIKVCGSYLSEKEMLGDLDVAVKVSQRYTGDACTKAIFKRIAAAKKEGRVFRSVMDEIFWPHKEVMLLLKTRKKGLSLHDEDMDDVVGLTETKIVYEFQP